MATPRRSLGWLQLLLVVACARAQWAVDDHGCTTPDQSAGDCRNIRDCKPIIDFIEKRRPLTMADRDLLGRYQCGFDRNVVKVCCPSAPIPGTDDGGGDGSVDSRNGVLRHPNLRLIPVDNCGTLASGDKILNGNITALFEFPWMALLRYSEKGKDVGFKCGGTLINKRYVLTGAHCITNLKGKVLTSVRLGEYDIKSEKDCETHFEGDTVCADPVQDFAAEETIPHAQYNIDTLQNDIGLLRLDRDANISVDSVKPVCLPFLPSVRNVDLKKGTVTGWGRTENSFQSNVLLKVELPIMAPEECKKRYANKAAITDKQICAGGVDEKDSCNGDSGGPLQRVAPYQAEAAYVQYGIVSFGPKICSAWGLPGVYTKVNKYLDWVLDNIKP